MSPTSIAFARRSEPRGVWGEKEEHEWKESAGSLLLLAAAQQTKVLTTLKEAMPIASPTAPPRFTQARSQTHLQSALTLLFLPVAGLERPWHLRSYAGDGLALLSGHSRAYGYRQIERFLTHWTQAGGAQRMTELLATWTAQLWKTPGTTYYLDGLSLAVFTDHLIPRGLIGRTGKILGCRALVLLHDPQGHPRFVTTGRGDTHLTQETTSVLKCYEEMLASEHVSTLVIDREGMSTNFLRRLTQDGHTIITILRSDQYTGLATFNTVGDFLPLQTDAQGRVIREVAPAQFQLDDLTLQVALIRDHRSQTTLPSADAVPRSPGFRWSDTQI